MFTLFSVVAIAQDEDIAPDNNDAPSQPRQKKYYLFSPRLSVTVPHPIGNASFKKTFVGLYDLNAGMNVMLYKGIFAGATFKNAELQITPTKIPDYDASMLLYSFALKAGSDFYVGYKNNILLSASVSAGQNNTKFVSFKTKYASEHPITGFKSSYVEPEVNMFFLIESDFGIGVTLSYSIIQHNFDPYALFLNDWAAFDKDNSGSTRYFSFGFGCYYGFSKRITK